MHNIFDWVLLFFGIMTAVLTLGSLSNVFRPEIKGFAFYVESGFCALHATLSASLFYALLVP